MPEEKAPPPAADDKDEKEKGSHSSNITVSVRVRPLSTKEQTRQSWSTVEVMDDTHVLAHDPDDKMGGLDYLRMDKTKTKQYRFDFAFGPNATQTEVY